MIIGKARRVVASVQNPQPFWQRSMLQKKREAVHVGWFLVTDADHAIAVFGYVSLPDQTIALRFSIRQEPPPQFLWRDRDAWLFADSRVVCPSVHALFLRGVLQYGLLHFRFGQ
jgi:hypothetical protein